VPDTPLSIYRSRINGGQFKSDPEQLKAVEQLDRLWYELVKPSKKSLWNVVTGTSPLVPRGIYLWGDVGRGKTWLMDLFFEAIPFEQKQRIHFHRFMASVHQGLRQYENSQDPLKKVSRDWAKDRRLLCLDEFFVSDIADAMLLASLLEGLFEQGVVLVATSNFPPDGLYRDGLQRARFLPAIELIKNQCQVLQLDGETDYRLRILKRSELFHFPLDEQADTILRESFVQMAAGCELATELEINGRQFLSKMRGDGVIWFDFKELCEKPRSTGDYIEISRSFNTVFISGLPVLGPSNADAARRFIHLVDEFYDRNVKLLISSAAAIEGIYTGDRLAFEFQRTVSRLNEMQSHHYLAKPHLP
jgi:cell division protein ZapE